MWYSPATVVAPAIEPVTLAAAKEFLRIDADDTSFDTALTGFIAGVREDVERITSTRLITQTVRLQADSFADLQRLPIGPVQSIVALTFVDSSGESQALNAADVELFGTGLDAGLRPVANATWPPGAIRAGSVVIEAVTGYGELAADIPPSIYVAMLRAVRGLVDDKPIALEPLLWNHRIWL